MSSRPLLLRAWRWAPAVVAIVGLNLGAAQEVRIQTRYGIVIDAGSSGSRAHVYSWRTGGDAGDFELVADDIKRVKPGLSAHAKAPSLAGEALSPLLAHAQETVPEAQWVSTPVFLMATAGLRILGPSTAAAIIRSAADALAASPFLFKHDWAYIMGGRDEGVFGWVTVNYLNGKLAGRAGTEGAGETFATIDLGGGSVQVVFEMPDTADVPSEYEAAVDHASRHYRLYAKSHGEMGMDRARERVAQILLEDAVWDHPCLPSGHEADMSAGHGVPPRRFHGTGSFQACADLYRRLFDTKAPCAVSPCKFGGVFQPTLTPHIFGFSYLYDRTGAIGLLGGAPVELGVLNLTLADIVSVLPGLCGMSPGHLRDRFANGMEPEKAAYFCGDVTYILVLLHDGFGVDLDELLTFGSKVGVAELTWTLGAAIARAAPAAAAAGSSGTQPAPGHHAAALAAGAAAGATKAYMEL